jgi:DNA-binding NarL/FixJ family response regulator
LLSGYATVEIAVGALNRYGAFTCLRKESFRRSEFRDWVDRALASAPPLEGEAPEPGAGGAASRPADAPPAEAPSPGTALIVEDDAGWRSILSELLADAGYEVRLCSSYGEALGRLRRERFVLAIVDLSLEGSVMPGSSAWGIREPRSGEDLEGYRLLAATRAGNTPTIVVSGVATADDIERAYAEYGVFACLTKQTFQRRAFLETLAEAREAAAQNDELDALTAREREVIELLARGQTNKEIAQALVITTNTVKRHLKSIFEKLEVHTRAAAAARAVRAGIPAEQ